MIDYFLNWSNDPLGQTHLALALISLLVGPVIFFINKGTGWHRIFGYIFIASMLGLNFVALWIYDFTGGFNFFHGAALFSLGTLTPAIAFLVAGIRTSNSNYLGVHGAFMGWTYFGLVTAAIAETVTRGFPYLLHGEGGWTRFIVILSIFMVFSAFLTNKFLRKRIPTILGTHL